MNSDLTGSLITGTAPSSNTCGTGVTSSPLTGTYTLADIAGYFGLATSFSSCYADIAYDVAADCNQTPCVLDASGFDPCVCNGDVPLNPNVSSTVGTFSDQVNITSNPGMTWTVTAVSNATGISTGTTMTEVSPGVYELPFTFNDGDTWSMTLGCGACGIYI